MIDHDAIRALASECARDALIATPSNRIALPWEVPAEYLERLAAALGRRPTRQEIWAFGFVLEDALEEATKTPEVKS